MRSAVLLGTSAVLAVAAPAAGVSFSGLGTLPGMRYSVPTAVSGDGRVIVGYSEAPLTGLLYATRWEAGTMTTFPFLEGYDQGSQAFAVSADGSVAVGQVGGPLPIHQAVRWDDGTPTGLGFLPIDPLYQDPYSEAHAVSADGNVVVGIVTSEAYGSEAFRWEDGTLVGLGHLGAFNGLGVSADGTTVLGVARTPSGSEAFLWDEVGGIRTLGDLPGGAHSSAASLISADLTTVIGMSPSSLGQEMFRWQEGSGMVGLGIPAGFTTAEPTAMTPDARRVVGWKYSPTSLTISAFLWTASNGYRDLEDFLAGQLGLDLTGWELKRAMAISADGRVIVGEGLNPAGQLEGWIAVVPEPSTFVLLGAGLLAFAGRRRGSRRS